MMFILISILCPFSLSLLRIIAIYGFSTWYTLSQCHIFLTLFRLRVLIIKILFEKKLSTLYLMLFLFLQFKLHYRSKLCVHHALMIDYIFLLLIISKINFFNLKAWMILISIFSSILNKIRNNQHFKMFLDSFWSYIFTVLHQLINVNAKIFFYHIARR